MIFKDFNEKVKQQFSKMTIEGKLYRSSITGKEIWDLYLGSFKKEDDPVFRDPDSSKHNGNLDKSFIRRYGNIVMIDSDSKVHSIFDISLEKNSQYYLPCKKVSKLLKNSTVSEVFFETFEELNSLPYQKNIKKTQEFFRLGIAENHKIYNQEEANKFGVVEPGKVYKFNHFHVDLPNAFVDKSGKSVESLMSNYRSAKEVFKRAMDEISLDTLELVKDLILQGSLLDGTTHLHKVEVMIPLKKEYDELAADRKDNWCWNKSFNLSFAKFKNELIGVLCSELSEGEDLNKACRSWNKRVDPANYMKAKAPITENQKKITQKFVEENGYVESFDRRMATKEDIKANEIKHLNTSEKIKSVSMFDNIKTASTRHKRNEFDGVEEVGIEKFMSDILPSCSSVELYLENRLENNMVSLTTANDPDVKQIFKWDNPFSWTYNGNLAGKSQIKESVKSQGGKVDGVLRFSIMWADGDGDNSDLDAHCVEPNNNRIYYNSKHSLTGGNLDIDIQTPQNHSKDVVENITYPSLNRMSDGTYSFMVHQYARRGSKGFKAEIEFDGEIYEYSYDKPLSQGSYIDVAKVTLKNGQLSIDHKLPSSNSSKEIYNLDTKQFHKVNLMCLSPNYWGKNNTGNKHYFFMLENCKTKSKLRSFHSENLMPELAKERKVLEVLGAVNMIEPSDDQLSGVGFNSTVRDHVILRLKGSHKRVVKVKI